MDKISSLVEHLYINHRSGHTCVNKTHIYGGKFGNSLEVVPPRKADSTSDVSTIKLRQVSSNLLVPTLVKVLQLPLLYILLNGSVAQRQSVRLLTARSRYRNSPEPPLLDSVRVRRDFKISFPFEVQCGLGRRRGERLFETQQRHLRKR